MKIVNDVLDKVGIDKILHFLGGGLISSLIIIFGAALNISQIISFLIGFIIVFVLSIIKEFLDDKFDWIDILAAMIGTLLSITVIGLGLLISFL